MIRIGITGGIGAGKSEITAYLEELGYSVIDADDIAREAAMPGEPSMLRLREEIGDGVFLEDGSLDRPALAKLMFYDPMVLMSVNEIFHGDIQDRIEANAKLAEERGDKAVFLSIPLLFESGADWKTDEVWLVTADEDTRIERVIIRTGMSETDVRARMDSQMSEEEKRKRADVIIENNGTLTELHESIDELLTGLLRRCRFSQ